MVVRGKSERYTARENSELNKYRGMEATSQSDGFQLLALNFVLLLSDFWSVCVCMSACICMVCVPVP